MNQKRFVSIALIVLIVVLAGVVGYFVFNISNPQSAQAKGLTAELKRIAKEPSGDYIQVTISELINNIDKYNGQKVSVRGNYEKVAENRGYPQCVQTGTGENPKLIDNYVQYPSTWGIWEQKLDPTVRFSVKVAGQNGIDIGTKPLFNENEEIELRGIARAATVEDSCNRDIRSKSIYLQIDVNIVPIPEKSEPENPPTSPN